MKAALLLTLIVSLAAAGCGGGGDVRASVTVASAGGPRAFRVEVADSAGERARGLAGREGVPTDGGMLFVYPLEHRGGFWMKDTLVPLTIAFVDAGGRLVSLLDMEPCKAEPCKVYDPGVPYVMALEVVQGQLAGAAVGDRVSVER